jgi:hypothetical protein
MLEGRTRQSREWRERVDPWWAKRLNMPDLTPRWILQYWGTEVCRRAFHDDIWIAALENKLRSSNDDVVISDCRFPNEIKSIKDAGGIVIRVARGAEPEWYDAAVSANRVPNGNVSWALSRAKLERLNVHASESSWVGTEFDAEVDNNSSMDHLLNQINDLVLDLRAAKSNQLL